jgi:hypothetical protein
VNDVGPRVSLCESPERARGVHLTLILVLILVLILILILHTHPHLTRTEHLAPSFPFQEERAAALKEQEGDFEKAIALYLKVNTARAFLVPERTSDPLIISSSFFPLLLFFKISTFLVLSLPSD